ncbi:MAG: MFS transporter, partial [Ruminococcus sp.]
IIDDTLYFSEITEDGIHVKYCFNDAVEECAFMPLDGANDIVADSTFSDDLAISAVLMNGDIYACQNGTNVLMYHAREYDTEEYFSLITEITYSNDGVLYANDIGQRRILSIDKNEIGAAIEKGEFSDNTSEEIALCPIYTGLNVSDNTISVLSAEYQYDAELDNPNYFYHIAAVDFNGNSVFYGNEIGISAGRRFLILCVYAAILMIALIAGYSIIRIIRNLRHTGLTQVKTQILVLVTAIAVTLGVSISVFHSSNERFADESAANLSNIAYLIDATIDKDIVKSIDTPDMYLDQNYEALNESVIGVLKNEVNENRNVYAVIYKVYNNVICEVYRNDFYHGIMYPMAGTYSGSIEEGIAENKTYYVSQDYELSEGSYAFSLLPSYDENGEVIAFIEVGTDYNYFVQENNRLFKKLLITASMAVIIIMLLFSELMNGTAAFRARKLSLSEKKQNPPEVIRPIAFLIFFTANITTAFLPIYGTSLWNQSFPLPAEVAAALPLSAELVFSASSALLCGFLIKKTGIRPICITGAIFYIGGNILSAFAGNLWMLICANSICGIGGGILTIAVNTWITDFADEEQQNKGFVHYNAAFLAGMNCGTVIGSLIWENFGITAAYMTAAVCAALIVIATLLLIEKRKVNVKEESKKEKKLSLRFFITPG